MKRAMLKTAFADWTANRAYYTTDKNGRHSYRIKGTYTADGRSHVAPWRHLVLARFTSCDDFHRAAHAFMSSPNA